ncbi:MAG: DUF1572 family protein [Flavobacteriales bacterium]|jgi:uncharacterized damage-inducible protein DinB|nr:DUF1572 family protein [Flavobacteriales bacterium]MBK9286158.1 DUF1572 family protein [Flavobacteriales bacterium]MBL0034528.1 DUF1572 family protein [Flavobacteriales bacterium]
MERDALTMEVIHQSVRRLREGQERIHHCVGLVDDAQLWHRANPNVVSVGNLILHLTGNVGQWINATLGARRDDRQRQQEFDLAEMDRRQLLERLDSALVSAIDVIGGLSTKDLTRSWNVQGFQESGLAIVLHVVEHFSYHVGQITLHTKLLKDVDTGYYAGQDLQRKG